MDGTGNEKDTSAKGQDSSGSGKETSTVETPETLMKAQIDKAVNDALSKAGRIAKSLNEERQRLEKDKTELTAKQVAWQKEKDEAEELAVADDAPALTALRDRRRKKAEDEAKATTLAEREANLAKREAEIADIIERDRILTRTQLAAEVAVAKGVPIDTILKLAKEDTREAYEAVADAIPKAPDKLPVIIADSGKTNKGGTPLVKARDKMLAGFGSLHPEGK